MVVLIIIKLLVTVSIVLGLSVITERVSPKVAGILGGYPLGAAIALFFFGVEEGADFAATSAIFNLVGLVATLVFLYAYYRASKYFGVTLTVIASIVSFVVAIWLLHFLEPSKFQAVLMPVLSVPLFIYLFRHIKNKKVKKRVSLTKRIIMFRAILASVFILSITGVANAVGPEWSGLFSAFPITVLPLLVIVQYTYGTDPTDTIIKNLPIGYFSLILYSLTISITYPAVGIYWGTLIGYIVASLYLALYYILSSATLKRTSS